MAWYRTYFVDRLARFRCPCDLDAATDAEALAMAYALQYACSDIHVGIELWQGARRIPGAFQNTPDVLRASWEQVSANRQAALLKLERSLLDSGTILSRSRRLAERIAAAAAEAPPFAPAAAQANATAGTSHRTIRP